MEYKWLNKQNNNNLIVFFNGWGMDEKIVQNLEFKNYDVLVFQDYRTFDMPVFDFSSYEKKYLVSWSMGVYVCNLFFDTFSNFNGYTAINGTQKPIDDNYGIPEAIYNLTIDNFNELTCSKFMKKISSTVNLKDYCTRSLEELKQELISIKDLKIKKNLTFNRAIISTKDRIFPYKNMINYWKEKNTLTDEVNGGHYIFDCFESWNELL